MGHHETMPSDQHYSARHAHPRFEASRPKPTADILQLQYLARQNRATHKGASRSWGILSLLHQHTGSTVLTQSCLVDSTGHGMPRHQTLACRMRHGMLGPQSKTYPARTVLMFSYKAQLSAYVPSMRCGWCGLEIVDRVMLFDATSVMPCYAMLWSACLLTCDVSSLLPPMRVYSKVTRRPVALK